jgi:hypothetical protein
MASSGPMGRYTADGKAEGTILHTTGKSPVLHLLLVLIIFSGVLLDWGRLARSSALTSIPHISTAGYLISAARRFLYHSSIRERGATSVYRDLTWVIIRTAPGRRSSSESQAVYSDQRILTISSGRKPSRRSILVRTLDTCSALVNLHLLITSS